MAFSLERNICSKKIVPLFPKISLKNIKARNDAASFVHGYNQNGK
jgi:hypothetical protein